ncbi:MAG: hypothetical protein RLZZ50_1647, partial [Verrucomicrobiota bacterium]
PPATSLIFQLAFSNIRHLALLRHTRPRDWFGFLRGFVRRPHVFFKAMRYRSASGSLWSLVLNAANARTREATLIPPSEPLYRKSN